MALFDVVLVSFYHCNLQSSWAIFLVLFLTQLCLCHLSGVRPLAWSFTISSFALNVWGTTLSILIMVASILQEWFLWFYPIIVGRLFANGQEDLGSIEGHVIPKTLKMIIDAFLLNNQQYKVRIKGKVAQSKERSSARPYLSM